MLGKPFFELSHDLQAATSFEEVAGLLSSKLPPLIGGDAAVIFETSENLEVVAVHGKCELAKLAATRLDEINRLLPTHPLVSRIDLSKPGELGVAVSDFVEPEEYRKSEFNRMLHDGLTADDGILGKLMSCCQRTTLLVSCRNEGTFDAESREIFDAILFTARAVLGRIGSMSVESTVKSFLMGAVSSPVAVFVIRPDAQVLPVSYEAVRLSEAWWGEDEAMRTMEAPMFKSLREQLRGAWLDPVTARFKATQLELGGGAVPCHALPKADGEIFIFMPVSGRLPSSDEALKAVLTKRLREIMEWIAEGKTSAEAAIILDISPRTVEKHLEAVFQRLGVENRISAVRRFLDLKAG